MIGDVHQKSVLSQAGRFLGLFSRRRKLQLIMLVALMIGGAIAEVATLGLIVPFLAIIFDPAQALSNSIVKQFADLFGVSSPAALLPAVTLSFTVVAILTAAVRILLVYANSRFIFGIGSELSSEAYRRTLYQPYAVHISRNTSEVVGTIKVKMDAVITLVLQPALTVVSSSIITVAIAAALFYINPIVASIALFGFGGIYLCVILALRGRLRRIAADLSRQQGLTVRAIQEGLSGIRDVILGAAQEKYTTAYRRADYPLRRAAATLSFLPQTVRYVVEGAAMVLIAVVAYLLASQAGSASTSIPLLGALALGGQRLLPVVQQLFASWSSIVGHGRYLSDVLDLLTQPVPDRSGAPPELALPFERSIELRNVSYRYSLNGPDAICNVSISLPRGARIGLMGPTGGGKSTLADIIMGLLEPQSGQLVVDGTVLTSENIANWQRNVAHVPQSIYLLDGSFADNIAIGDANQVPTAARLLSAAENSQIASFISGSKLGMDTGVGENGVRLSGGQKQRIGIARALFKGASLLVLDEATSALDNETESAVMQAIEGDSGDLTMVIIAHRLSTLQNCDIIYKVDGGRIVSSGSYAEMVQ